MMQQSSTVLRHILKPLQVNFVCIAKYSRRNGSDSKFDDVFKIVGKNGNHMKGKNETKLFWYNCHCLL